MKCTCESVVPCRSSAAAESGPLQRVPAEVNSPGHFVHAVMTLSMSAVLAMHYLH